MYYENGKLMYEKHFDGDRPTGDWKFYYENGNLHAEGNFDKNDSTGSNWKFYNDKGEDFFAEEYDSMAVLDFTADHRPLSVTYYKGNSETRYQFNENYTINTKGRVVNGLKEGRWEFFYANGQKMLEANYAGGKENGAYNSYRDNGVPYFRGFYINGQRANDETRPVMNEDGSPKLDNDGNPVYEQYQIYFTADEIQRIHDEAKLNDQGEDTAPYVIAAGNQAFWGWVIFDAKADVDYWLFQDSSQVGFGGFEFNAGGTDGIENVQAVKVQDNRMFNLQGQVVGNDYKGIVIMNGKKIIKK